MRPHDNITGALSVLFLATAHEGRVLRRAA
jgi:hypothetical protein